MFLILLLNKIELKIFIIVIIRSIKIIFYYLVLIITSAINIVENIILGNNMMLCLWYWDYNRDVINKFAYIYDNHKTIYNPHFTYSKEK